MKKYLLGEVNRAEDTFNLQKINPKTINSFLICGLG
jgi:hypothetical protein